MDHSAQASLHIQNMVNVCNALVSRISSLEDSVRRIQSRMQENKAKHLPVAPTLAHKLVTTNTPLADNTVLEKQDQQQALPPTLILEADTFSLMFYTDRDYPAFVVRVIDSSTGTVFRNTKGWKLGVRLYDGFGARVDHMLNEEKSRFFHEGVAQVSGLRFLEVSSKNGSHFNLECHVTFPSTAVDGVRKVRSGNLIIYSARLYHTHKGALRLQPSDSIARLPNVGQECAAGLAKHGIRSIQELAQVPCDPDTASSDQRRRLLEAVRREVSTTLTDERLVSSVVMARAIASGEGFSAWLRFHHDLLVKQQQQQPQQPSQQTKEADPSVPSPHPSTPSGIMSVAGDCSPPAKHTTYSVVVTDTGFDPNTWTCAPDTVAAQAMDDLVKLAALPISPVDMYAPCGAPPVNLPVTGLSHLPPTPTPTPTTTITTTPNLTNTNATGSTISDGESFSSKRKFDEFEDLWVENDTSQSNGEFEVPAAKRQHTNHNDDAAHGDLWPAFDVFDVNDGFLHLSAPLNELCQLDVGTARSAAVGTNPLGAAAQGPVHRVVGDKVLEQLCKWPLHTSVQCGSVDKCEIVVRGMLRRERDVNEFDDNKLTPLMLACVLNFPHVTRYLCSLAGTNPHCAREDGWDALLLAVMSQSLDCVSALLGLQKPFSPQALARAEALAQLMGENEVAAWCAGAREAHHQSKHEAHATVVAATAWVSTEGTFDSVLADLGRAKSVAQQA